MSTTKPSVKRRDFLKVMGAAGVAATAGVPAVRGLSSTRRASAQSSGLIGKVIITKSGPLSVHTYMAPAASVLVTSHLIETPNHLVLVDTQFAQTFAKEVRAYADSLGKPIERVILSHQHPDHWLGANNFADLPFSATAAVATSVQEQIDGGALANFVGLLGEAEVPTEPYVPTDDLAAGELLIDGVTLLLNVFNDAEAPEQVVVRLPEAGIVIAQDLMFNNTHFFPLGNNTNWLSILEGMRAWAGEGYDTLLSGHGMPSSFGEIDEAVTYLTFLEETLTTAATADEASAAIVARYPGYGGQFLLTFIANRFAQ